MLNKENTQNSLKTNKLFRCSIDIVIGLVLLCSSFLQIFSSEPFSFVKVFFSFFFVFSIYLIYKSLLLLIFGLPRLKIIGDTLQYTTLFKKQTFPINQVFITKQTIVFEKYIYIKVNNKKLIFTYYSLDKEFRKALNI
jgi:hypothetical protein